MLYCSEIKKLLFAQRGLLLLVLCLIFKCVFIAVFPEQKDGRIKLSQKQYDKYLTQLYGENTPKKSGWIISEYETCRTIKERQQAMQAQYARGEVTEEEWNAYCAQLAQAELHINAAEIFAEKARQFAQQQPTLPPAHYIYEYGWQTVFTLGQLPDVFLLLGLLMLAAQCFSAEASSGMLSVLLAARDGRRRLFYAKLAALLSVATAAALIFGGAEMGIFAARGWCNDSDAPLYSVKILKECTLPLPLFGGYCLALVIRSLAALLLAAFVFALSVWLRNPGNLIFLALCFLTLPMLWHGGAALYTHGGFLCGTRLLLESPSLPLMVVAGYTAALTLLAARRHQKGL